MVTFVSLHRGRDIKSARLLGVTCDPVLASHVADAILSSAPYCGSHRDDEILDALEGGRRKALRIVSGEEAAVDARSESNDSTHDGHPRDRE